MSLKAQQQIAANTAQKALADAVQSGVAAAMTLR
jgi:hypothetical protein